MTREEHIEILKQYREKPTLIDEISSVEEAEWLDESLDAAIKALEQGLCEDCQRIYKPNPYYDCISRQNTIDAIWEELDEDTAHEVRDILETQPSVIPEQEPCEDAVSRRAVIEVLTKNRVHFCDMIKITSELKELLPVTPQFKTGHWIPAHTVDDGSGVITWYKCSECGRCVDETITEEFMVKDYPYCHCGAKMLPTDSDCDSCDYQNEVDGSNCYECVKGIRNNYKADSEKE